MSFPINSKVHLLSIGSKQYVHFLDVCVWNLHCEILVASKVSFGPFLRARISAPAKSPRANCGNNGLEGVVHNFSVTRI